MWLKSNDQFEKKVTRFFLWQLHLKHTEYLIGNSTCLNLQGCLMGKTSIDYSWMSLKAKMINAVYLEEQGLVNNNELISYIKLWQC